MNELVPYSSSQAVGSSASWIVVPTIIADAGDQAARRFLEFFAATIRNKNTRMAYYRAVLQFFAWCDQHQLGQLVEIEPLHVAAYIEALQKHIAKPSVKQHLAAIRMLFDWLVTGGIVATNPAHAVRGPKHVVKRGKTPVLTPEEARALLDSIDTSTVVGLRDRALISVMTFTFARVGAVVDDARRGLLPPGQALVGAAARERRQAPRDAGASHARSLSGRLYRRGRHPRQRQEPPLPLGRVAQRRAHGQRHAPHRRLPHDPAPRGRYGPQGAHQLPYVPGDRDHRLHGRRRHARKCAAMAAHESPRTTKLYDRTGDEITLDEVERIRI